MDTIDCKQCSGQMSRTKKTDSNIGLQLVGVVVFFLGLLLLFIVPIGTIIGLCMMLAALGMGYKKRKVWKCGQCGYFFDRD